MAGERRRAVLAALATLPPEQRAALVLVDMEGYPVGEAATILGCAAGTVKSPLLAGPAPGWPRLLDLEAHAGDRGHAAGGNPTSGSSVRSPEPRAGRRTGRADHTGPGAPRGPPPRPTTADRRHPRR